MSTSRYQECVEEWLAACFPPSVTKDRQERTRRFLDEAFELAQANGCTHEHAIALVNYVYSRPEWKPELEVDGVMVTPASLCSATKIDTEVAGNAELCRNWDRIDVIRKKQAAKPPGFPLPQ